MRAAVVNESHSFDIVDVPDPSPGPSELVLRVDVCGICGSDLKAVDHMPSGLVMGHEFSGRVVAAGKEVASEWPEGQMVTALPLIGCGTCVQCQSGDVYHCATVDPIGVGGSSGGYAEYVRVSARESFALPESLHDGYGALVEPLAVGLHAVERAALDPGDSVLVLGAGPVGLAVVTWARLLGAGRIVVVEPSAPRREASGMFGATETIDPADAPANAFDVVIECVGIPGMIDAAVAATAVHGRIVVAGVCTRPDPFTPISALLKELAMHFVVYYRRRDFAHTIAMLERGTIDPGPFVTDRVDLASFAAAFTALKTPSEQRKVLLQP